jgi:uncharacterized protein
MSKCHLRSYISGAAKWRRGTITGFRTMNAQERQLIADVFAGLRDAGRGPKDQDADAFIRDLVRQFPDAPYFLTQSVIVQQQALEQADARIIELEETIRKTQLSDRASGGSFLGGARIPNAGGRFAATSDDRPQQPGASPWSSNPSPASAAPQGSFLSSVLSTATGVAGGMFLADSIKSLFGSVGGRSYVDADASSLRTSEQAALDRAQDEAQDARDDAEKARQDLAADDAALDDMQDAQDDSSDASWSDDGGLDA